MERNSVPVVAISTVAAMAGLHLAWRWIRRRAAFVQAVEALPGPPLSEQHALLAHLYEYLSTLGTVPGKPGSTAIEPYQLKYGAYDGLFRVWVFHPYIMPFARAIVFVYDPILVREVLVENGSKLVRDQHVYSLAKPILGKSLLALQDCPAQRQQRKMAAMAFTQPVLENAASVVSELLYNKVFSNWIGTNDAVEVEMMEWSTRMIMEVLGRVAFSHSFGGLDCSQQSMYDMYQTLLITIAKRSLSPPILWRLKFQENRSFNEASRKLDALIHDIIQERMTEGDTSGGKADLLSFMMGKDEVGKKILDYDYIFGNVRMFLFAGHDTTASVLANACWHLAVNGRVQEKLQNEVDSMFAKNRDPKYKDLMQLKYLDAVVKEACATTRRQLRVD